MADPSGPRSLLYRRLRLVQRAFPLIASIPILVYEFFEHAILTRPILLHPFVVEILIYGILSPAVMFLILTWLLRRVGERDQAEARLSALYEVSRESASATELDELQDLALSLPERAGLAGARASLVVQDAPAGPWLLAGTRGLGAPEVAALESGLAGGELRPGCARCTAGASKAQCRLLEIVQGASSDSSRDALCLMLSRESERQVVLTIYLPGEAARLAEAEETLESMAAGLAVALDRVRLQARERELLRQVERAVRAEQLGLVPTLQRILADIAEQQSIAAGAVFLFRGHAGGRSLAPVATWPGPAAGTMLAQTALHAVQVTATPPLSAQEVSISAVQSRVYGSTPPGPFSPASGVAAVPLTSEGEALGVLVIAPHAGTAEGAGARMLEEAVLEVVTSMMALLIRNSQLYTQLESRAVLDERSHLAAEVHDGLAQSLAFLNVKVQQVQRLLGRGQVAEAAVALQELREGSQEVYTEVRSLIQGLRWTMGVEAGLARGLQQYGAAVALRTGLAVTVDAPGDPDLPPEAQLQLFRVVQEALNNVHQHAHARHVTVRLSEAPECVALTVEDDGIGLRTTAREGGDHFGLRIMRERVQSIGGELKAESRAGEGTSLYIRVPTGVTAARRGEDLWNAFGS